MNIESLAFKTCMGALDSLGPIVSTNPKIDKAYKTLRLMGVPEREAKEMIQEEIDRRLKSN